jgi:CubicO group peptidase (beta-lactamase class C family)
MRVVTLFLLLLSAVPGWAQPADFAAKAKELLKAHDEVNQFSGAVLVARNGNVLLRTGIGLANREWNIANTPETKMRLGSITKQFTAACILLLEQQKKLSVGDTLDKHIPDAPQAWKKVTIHHLLTHTGGVPSYTNDPAYGRNKFRPMPLPDLIALFRDKPLEFDPGTQWKYSNSGYVLLGDIIQRASGIRYESFLQKYIFGPLEMKNSGYDHWHAILPNRASGYSRQGNEVRNADYLDMSQPHAAGALYSTVDDLHLWDRALYTDKLLPQDVRDRMFTPVKSNYAYGWTIGNLAGRKVVGHGGGIDGFSTMIMRIPDDQSVVIVLSNLQQANAQSVATGLAAILYGAPYQLPKVRKEISLNPELYDKYIGVYELAPNFRITVTREGQRLMTQATGQPKFEVFPESETQFFLKVVDAQLTFVKGSDGKATQLILHQGGRDMPAKRVE